MPLLDGGVARLLLAVGGLIFCVLGGWHAVATLRDLRRPRFFTPIDHEVRQRMKQTGLKLAGGRTSLWQAWLGFNLSHGLGALVFGTASLYLAFSRNELQWALPFVSIVSTAYLWLSWRFWFYAPTAGIGLATLCFALAWIAL